MNTKTITPLDKHLDAILRASGSALRNYGASGKTIDGMRTALAAAITEMTPVSAPSASDLSDDQIDEIFQSHASDDPEMHIRFARAVIAHALHQSKS